MNISEMDSKEYTERCVDALDHIMRTARSARVSSKRLTWIASRAESAINGDERWRTADVPRNGEAMTFRLRARIKELEDQIAKLTVTGVNADDKSPPYRYALENGYWTDRSTKQSIVEPR